MIRKLQRLGDDVALVFDKTMLEALNITADTLLHVTFSNGVLTVAPTHTGIAEEELETTIKRLRPRYKRMLDNLAVTDVQSPGHGWLEGLERIT